MVSIRALAILLFAAAPLLADTPWYEDYQKGLDALRQGQNAAAVGLLESAISKNGEPSASARTYGVIRIKYFPHFALGRALYGMGRYQDAIDSFAREERYGQILGVAEDYRELVDLKNLAQARLQAGSTPKTTTTPPPVTAPPPEIRAVPKSTPGSTVAKTETPPVSTVNPPPPTTVDTPPATDPGIDQKRVAQYMQQGFKALNVKNTTKAREYFQKALALDQSNVAAAEALTKTDEIERAVQREKMSMQDLLRKGLTEYFAGDYPAATLDLEALLARDYSNALARFYLGCTHATLFLLSGEQDQDLKGRAEEHFRLLAHINPTYHPDTTFVSPAIMKLYGATTGH